ncbi:G2/mitotic-specific cyclin-B-like [Anneissia japonica]|uniref:G2/mitotic-specific cyclin-B-like n=1 Tax=Anneissia japonica TaxID=1529436 RepID=UPI00142551DF|nr:G2/mitotic-specific cyclin-B-like [Anneissia japonica]
MAVRTRAQTYALVGHNTADIENQANARLALLAAKTGVTTRNNGDQPRAALGNISNVARQSNRLLNKAVKKDRPTRMTKSKATSSLHSVTSLQPQNEVEPKSPEAMDTVDVGEIAVAFSEKMVLNIEDIDKNDTDNPQLCCEYVNDIYDYMRQLERALKVNKDYMENQAINSKMRTILVDWLVQVHLRFHLLQETLFLTVQLIDRYLEIKAVSKDKLQLVGVTAMFIASKYEEMYPPEIGDFVYITDNAYTQSQIRSMEIQMLSALNFGLGKPLCIHFLRRNSKAGEVTPKKHTLAKYLMELTLPDYEMVQYDPSEIAAAALCLSMKLLDAEAEWNPTLVHYSTYTESYLMPIMKKIAAIVHKSPVSKYQAVRSKYASNKFLKISTLPELTSTTIQHLAETS